MFDRLLMNRVGRYKDLVILASWQVQAIFSWRKRWAILLGSYDRFGLYRSGSCRAPWATVWLPTVAGPLGRTDVCTYTAMHTGGGGRTEVVGTGRRSHHQPINLSCVSMIQTKFVSENKTKFHLLGVMWLYSSVPSRFYLCNTHQWVDKKSKSKSIGDFDSTDKSQTGKSFAPPPNLGNGLNEKKLTWPDVMFFEIINHFDRVEIWGTD